MKAPGHVMILASAGSGKTYALTNRFLQLLASGAAPERIVALTFTRKAAGEFFDEILHKLARGSSQPAVAQQLAREMGIPELGQTDFLRMLRQVIEAMPRLNLGTLDAFFARIVRSFPLELGLGGDFALLEETAARRERQLVLQRLFTTAGEPDASQRGFIEAFKQATFGTEEKQLMRRLNEFLDQHANVWLDVPQADCWGNPQKIWPEGAEWFEPKMRRDVMVQTLRLGLPWAVLNDKQRTRLENFLVELPGWQPGAPLPAAMEYLLKNSFAVWDELRAGQAEITLERKKVSLDPTACAALTRVVRMIVGDELIRRMEMTRGLFAVLQGYDSIYHEAVRRGGRLTFADVQRLLLPAAGAPELSGSTSGDGRLMIDWRLDAQFDHWLLDEFQDTSFAQWSVLRNLIDEAVQDPERRRSLFYVGDVKQAIFAWREGDPRLFREIFNHYNQVAHGAIVEEHLSKSWRSGPAVIAMVNRVFGDGVAVRSLVPTEAAKRWVQEWQTHTVANPDLGGYAELRHADDEEGRFAETLKILREVEPARRGLSVAVIVQKNDTGTRLADYLRRQGLRAVAESDLHIATDNPLNCTVLALLRAAAHPGDTMALEHLRMTPLAAGLIQVELDTGESLTDRLLRELHDDGFATTIERWLRLLEAKLETGDQFSLERGRLLVAAARGFDEIGRRDVAEFVQWAESCTVRETETAGVVRVLTVHKAKGLGFDLVILPELEGQTMALRREGLAVHKAPDRSVNWVLELPGKLFIGKDEVLSAHVSAKEADAAYETLCKFYVALTRAKRAMYVITKTVGSSTSQNFPKLLEQTLGDAWSEGDPVWYFDLMVENKINQSKVALVPLAGSMRGRVQRLTSRRPSDIKTGQSSIAVFGSDGSAAADFGMQVHAIFETVEWWEKTQVTQWVMARRKDGANEAALTEVLNCLQATGVTEVFIRPPGLVDLWRERAFEVVLDGVWLTGVFDRVIVERDGSGQAVRAQIIDYKTDRGGVGANTPVNAEQRHAGQLSLYRRVVAILTGLPEAKVRCTLIMTAYRVAVDLNLSD